MGTITTSAKSVKINGKYARPFEGGKTTYELGIDKERTFVYVGDNFLCGARRGIEKGDILTLVSDNNTTTAAFTCKDKPEENYEYGWFECWWSDLCYLPKNFSQGESVCATANPMFSKSYLEARSEEIKRLEALIEEDSKIAERLNQNRNLLKKLTE
jgi:hypothetical protein